MSPPGARLRVALTGLTMAEYFREEKGSGRAPLRRQHLPLRPGGLRGVGAPRPDALRGGLPADHGVRDGRAAGADHVDQGRLGDLDAGRIRARRTTSRTRRRSRRSRTSTRRSSWIARSPSSASTRPSTRSSRRRGCSTRRSSVRSTTTPPAKCSRRSSATPTFKRHHRDPRYRGALGRGQAGRPRARAASRSSSSQPFFVAEQFTGMAGRLRPARRHGALVQAEILEGKHDDVGPRTRSTWSRASTPCSAIETARWRTPGGRRPSAPAGRSAARAPTHDRSQEQHRSTASQHSSSRLSHGR